MARASIVTQLSRVVEPRVRSSGDCGVPKLPGPPIRLNQRLVIPVYRHAIFECHNVESHLYSEPAHQSSLLGVIVGNYKDLYPDGGVGYNIGIWN
ncbi:hypothetical protein H2201_002502 [Coniosporium apollinis]|uniref:Uncharacterized protein n=1 Tax=Coniosporium apollinis TaxID=61459 RepID=A0ABQ9NZZ6_9PEZI|nr:hypothetical protein H2201_002502 [Coniosporium apollinis]